MIPKQSATDIASQARSFWEQTDYYNGGEYFMSFEEVARRMKVTREKVRIIEAKALKKLRQNSQCLKPFFINHPNKLDFIFKLKQ